MATSYFISDLHLHPAQPAVEKAFYAFTSGHLNDGDRLYILGDFFDAWIGDDEDSLFYLEIKKHLRGIHDGGVETFFMRGNRDFLIGEQFAKDTGVVLLEDPHPISLYGVNTLLMHGDTLCTGDLEYMDFRAQVRSDVWQEQILALPLEQRRQMAAELRSKSKSMTAIKASDIMDVAPDTVEQVFLQSGVRRIIHGHTHRPKTHSLNIEGRSLERVVLGDWHNKGWYVKANDDSFELVSFLK